MIKLKRLAVIDLNTRYARVLEGNKIKHYIVPFNVSSLGSNSDDIVKKHVAKELNVSLEEVQIEERMLSDKDRKLVKEVPEVLKGLKKVKKQLLKRKINKQLYVYTHDTLTNPLHKILRSGLRMLNFLLKPFKKHVKFEVLHKKTGLHMDLECSWIRRVSPCSYLTVAFEESDRQKAYEMLRNDLKILADKNVILGHMQMPFTMEMVDSIGSDQKKFILACFLFTDWNKISESVNVNERLPLKAHLGLKTESFEGLVSDTELNPAKKHDIVEENVQIPDAIDPWKAYIDHYNENRGPVRSSENKE
jgi:hypothetical protein